MKRWHFMSLLFGAMAFFLAGCGEENLSALQPKGPVAEEQLFLMKLSLTIMILVLAVVFLLFFYVLIRFRRRPWHTEPPVQVEGNHKLEVLWTVVPILLLLVLAVPTVGYTFKHDQNFTDDPNALQVKVTGHQFWWEFEYPEQGIVTAQDLVIPVGKTIQFELHASDVLHSFWVPALGGKKDNLVGITNYLYLQADEPGVYAGKCTELCGASHALMDFKVIAYEEADFEAWVAKMKTPPVIPAEAAVGQQIFASRCLQCHAVGGQGTRIGPALDGFASREVLAGYLSNSDDELLRQWIDNPQKLKPGNKMPAMGLSSDEVTEVIKYLRSLK